MTGIRGISGVPEPTPERPATVRDREREEKRAESAQDGVRISAEAQQAAHVKRLIDLAKEESDIRADRVAEARESIERGDHRNLEVLREVARNLLRYFT